MVDNEHVTKIGTLWELCIAKYKKKKSKGEKEKLKRSAIVTCNEVVKGDTL